MERFFEDIHIRTSMINDATGMALIVRIAGESSCPNHCQRAESPANITPAITAQKKPPAIRISENPTACQKSAVQTSWKSLKSTAAGDTKSISCPIAILAACHTASQKMTAHNLIFFVFFLSAEIEIIPRHLATDGLGILFIQNIKIT